MARHSADTKLDLETLQEAFEFAAIGPPGLAEAYIDRETGEYYIVSDYGDDDHVPDDLESDRYMVLPDKSELDLGKRLALRFATEFLEQDVDEVEFMFRAPGAYARFKTLLERRSLLQHWYDYERQAQQNALREWAEEQGLKLAD